MIDNGLSKLEKAWQGFLKELDTPEGTALFIIVMWVIFFILIPGYVGSYYPLGIYRRGKG